MDIEDFGNMCMGCMQDKGDSDVCPRCGYQMDRRRSPSALPYQSILNNKFLVGRILGKPGGFGITYLAWDLVLHTAVAIKEYLPRELATRDTNRATVVTYSDDEETVGEFSYGLKQFLNEARTLCKFSHPNVVRVREFFEQNKTAYLAMDYYEGISLEDYLKRSGGALAEGAALALMMPILDGVREIHAKGFLHRDIKPANIYITKSGTPILLDFGAARLALQGQRSRPLSVIFTPGFAPFEQYLEQSDAGPTIDIYALGATLYYLVTGVRPQAATERLQKDDLPAPDRLSTIVSHRTSQAIMSALALKPEERPQSIDALWAMLLPNEPAGGGKQALPNTAAASPAKPRGQQQVHCPHCKASNPVPANTDLSRLFCARCGKKLAKPKQARAAPLWPWALLGLSMLAAGLVLPWRAERPPAPKIAEHPLPDALPQPEAEEATADAPSGNDGGEAEGAEVPLTEENADQLAVPENPASKEANPPQEVPPHPLRHDEAGAPADGKARPPHRPEERHLAGHPPPYPPPQNAIDECHGKGNGTACALPGPDGRQHGLCQQIHDYFACAPEPAPPPRQP
jgi:serine/threonine protein kinase